MNDFYNDLAHSYHLIFEDWYSSISRQGDVLSDVIRERWGRDVRTVLDVACGIGTQAIALASLGVEVTASDLSGAAVGRAKQGARYRDVDIEFSVCNMLHCHDHHNREFGLVVACDNSIPHLLTDTEILTALQQMYVCVRPVGGAPPRMRVERIFHQARRNQPFRRGRDGFGQDEEMVQFDTHSL